MQKLRRAIHIFYLKIINSIAFYPVLISIAFFSLAIFFLNFNGSDLSNYLKENFSLLFVTRSDVARTILSTLISGIISLTVFSFSMVMIVLSLASSNLSPRVISGVITKKSNQIVLGFFIGTLVYCIILINNIRYGTEAQALPLTGIFLSEVLSIFCLALFVYFIHNISQSIQVDNILQSIFGKTSNKIDEEKHPNNKIIGEIKEPDTKDWEIVTSMVSGYYKKLEIKRMIETVEKNDLIIEILPAKSEFIIINQPLLKINRDIDDSLKEKLLNYFIFYENEYINEDYIYGFKQISEVAVKALSPGINDPGTAIRAINNLAILYSKILDRKKSNYYFDGNDELRVIENKLSLDELLFKYLTPIREYGKNDISIMLSLIGCIKNLIYADKKNENTEIFIKHIKIIIEDAGNNIENSSNRNMFNDEIERIKKIIGDEKGLEKLK